MPNVTWLLPDGRRICADVPAGLTLMEAAVANNVPNVVGECGGCLSCATCHVYVDETWTARIGGAGEIEDGMLEATPAPRQANSRLSCQITVSIELDGLVLHVPAE